jgi:hypothetical protein
VIESIPLDLLLSRKRLLFVALFFLLFSKPSYPGEGGNSSLPLLLKWYPGIAPLVQIGEELVTTLDRDRYILILRALNRQTITAPPSESEREERFFELIRTILLYSLAQGSRSLPPSKEIEGMKENVLFALGVSEGEIESRIGISPSRLSFELQRILAIRRYTTEGIAREIVVSEEEIREYSRRFQSSSSDREQVQKLLFLEKLRAEVRKLLIEKFRSERIHWYIPPPPEDKILGEEVGKE